MEENRYLVFYPNQGRPEMIAVPQQELYQGEIDDMHAAILDGDKQYLSLNETRNHIHTILALYRSANTGMPVKLT